MAETEPTLSIVIPVYNEEAALRSTLEEVARYLTGRRVAHEVLLIDDGSRDQTVSIARQLEREFPVRLFQSPHLGKGAAVKRGMLEAHGRYRLFMDADHSTHIREWDTCAPWLQEGFEVVIGSRKMAGANVMVRQPPVREAMGKVFTRLTNAMLSMNVSDITCGFKTFHAEAAQRIFSLQRMDGWGFDAEILFIAKRLGYRIKEVPVVWADDASTKVHLFKDAARSFTELIDIRLGALRGAYPTAPRQDLAAPEQVEASSR